MPRLGQAPGSALHSSQVNVNLTDDTLARLREIASAEGVAMAHVIRRAIGAEIARIDKRAKRSGKVGE